MDTTLPICIKFNITTFFAGHPKVKAFITHSGMLSTSETIHCGVPIVSVPLFGDQFANGFLAVENGLGVTVDVTMFKTDSLENALSKILQDK